MFGKLLLGHLVGDFVLQTNAMAWNKPLNTKTGYLACFIHCVVYSICVSLIVSPAYFRASPDIFLFQGFIFLTHYPIDKWSLAKHWITKVLGREMPGLADPLDLKGFIFWLVYVVVDNTFHLLLMYWGIHFFFPGLV